MTTQTNPRGDAMNYVLTSKIFRPSLARFITDGELIKRATAKRVGGVKRVNAVSEVLMTEIR
jgi:hypothetical protein